MVFRSCLAFFMAVAGCLELQAQELMPGLYDRPVLVLDPGVHTAPIFRAEVDAAGRIAVTGSHDRTIRVWAVDDGKLLHTIRVPQGPGNVGKISAVAIDPDGKVIAAGGWTQADPQEQIYLFDARSGAMIHRIEGLSGVVGHLAFSPDGLRLAATLGGEEGLRIYDRDQGWTEVNRDVDYGGDSYGAAFAPDGRLATSSHDGNLRLYDVDGKLVRAVATGVERPYGVAFSPDGSRLAVGFLDAPDVLLFDGHILAPLPPPDVSGIDNGSLAFVAWSTDGETLFAGGLYDENGVSPVIAWEDGGSGPRRALPAGLNTIMTLAPLPSGDLLVASQDPWLGRLAPEGTPRWTKAPKQMDPRAQHTTLAVSDDGAVVDFGYEAWGERPARFDVVALTLTANPPEDGRTSMPEQAALDIQDWINSFRPTLNGSPIRLDLYERSTSLAIHPDGDRFLLGADWWLRAFNAAGEELWRKEVPGVVWTVNISGDGRLGIAAYADGTIRWHRMEDGAELLALFPMVDGENWVAWTPEGVYAATSGARGILRWHVNRGWDAAEAIPVSDIPETHRPEVLPHVLPQLGTAGAIAVAELAKIRSAVQRVTRAAVAPGARLHVLAAGVSDYGPQARHLTLDYAEADARDLLDALERSQTGLYAEVVPQFLPNDQATRGGLLRALDSMRALMARGEGGDVAVVHFSGHGAVVDGNFYLLTHDVDARDPVGIRSTALSADVLREEIAKLARHGRVIVLLDACRSGATTASGKELTADADLLRAQLRGPNVTILTSSSASENSVEDAQWENGAFTEAVLAALTTRADADQNGVISMVEMTRFVSQHVPQITGGAQTPGVDMRFESQVFVAGL